MTFHARILPRLPRIIQGTGGVTVAQTGGIATIGFDYTASELGTQLNDAVVASAASAVTSGNSATASAASAVASAVSAAAAAASAASIALPSLVGAKRKVLQVKYDESGYEEVDPKQIGANVVSILSGVSDAKRADILAGTNALDITSELQTLIANVSDGTTIDLAAIRNVWTLTADPFNGLTSRDITLRLGRHTIKNEFNSNNIRVPSLTTIKALRTKIIPLTTLTTIPGTFDSEKGMLSTIFGQGTCTGVFPGKNITVNSNAGLQIGTRMAIFGVLPDSALANTLAGNIGSADATIALSVDTSATLETGDGYIQIGNEFIHCSIAGTTVTVLARGALGTTAATHTAGTAVTALLPHISNVTGISGTTITLEDSIPNNFTTATFYYGAYNTTIIGDLDIDGQFAQTLAATNFFETIGSTLSRRLTIGGRVCARGGAHGGLFLYSASDFDIHLAEITNCGKPLDALGADIWVFGGCRDGRIRTDLQKAGYTGIEIDDKSNGLGNYGLCSPNHSIKANLANVTATNGVDLSGSYNCSVEIDYLNASSASASLWKNQGQSTRDLTTGNFVHIKAEAAYIANGGDALDATNTIIHGVKRRIVKTLSTGTVFVGAAGGSTVTASFAGAQVGDIVTVNPATDPAAGLGLAYARVSATDVVKLGFVNSTAGNLNWTQDVKVTVDGAP